MGHGVRAVSGPQSIGYVYLYIFIHVYEQSPNLKFDLSNL